MATQPKFSYASAAGASSASSTSSTFVSSSSSTSTYSSSSSSRSSSVAEKYELVDIGINLTSKQFSRDWQAVLDRSRDAGVTRLILTGTSLRSSVEAHQLVHNYGTSHGVRLYSTAGVHPHDAKSWDTHTGCAIEALLAKKEVVAVGECGLDFDRNFSPQDKQKECFIQQLEISSRIGKPLFLHERAASEAFLQILRDYRARTSSSLLPPGVVHCFTGTADELKSYLDIGMHIGITGWIADLRRGKNLASIVNRIPPEKLMVETDAPFLYPGNAPSKASSTSGGSKTIRRNEPSLLPYVVKKISESTSRSEADIARETTQNAKVFFGLSDQD